MEQTYQTVSQGVRYKKHPIYTIPEEVNAFRRLEAANAKCADILLQTPVFIDLFCDLVDQILRDKKRRQFGISLVIDFKATSRRAGEQEIPFSKEKFEEGLLEAIEKWKNEKLTSEIFQGVVFRKSAYDLFYEESKILKDKKHELNEAFEEISAAENDIVVHNLGLLAQSIQYAPSYMNEDDAFQQSFLYLRNAISQFDHRLGKRFYGFAMQCIKHEFHTYLLRNEEPKITFLSEIEYSSKENSKYNDGTGERSRESFYTKTIDPISPPMHYDNALIRSFARRFYADTLRDLDERSRQVIEYNVAAGIEQKRTLKELGLEWGVTKEAMRQLKDKTLRDIEKRLFRIHERTRSDNTREAIMLIIDG